MKFTRFLVPAILVAGMSNMVMAADDDLQPVTFTINSDNGNLTGSGNYRSTWTSNSVEDGLTVVSNNPSGNPANNFNPTFNNGWLQLNTGNPGPTTVVIEPINSDKWYVSSYSFKAIHNTDATNLTLAIQGKAAVSVVSGTELVVSETVAIGTEASFVFAGTNGKPITLKDFTVTISPVPGYVEPEYVLPVEADLIIDGEFDEWTTWYNLQISTGQLALYNNGKSKMTLDNSLSGTFVDPKYQWCFVAEDDETVRIYNRELGTSMMLAAPKQGHGYPRMMEPGNENYCYTWKVNKAQYINSGSKIDGSFDNKNSLYISLSDNPAAILNKLDGTLDFWTGGYDNGSVIVPVVIETKLEVNMQTGYYTRNGQINTANRWQNPWNYGGQLNIAFGTNVNNMTTTTGDVTTGDIQLASGGSGCTYGFQIPSDYYVSDFRLNCAAAGEDGVATFTAGPSNPDMPGLETYHLEGTEKHQVRMLDLPYDFNLEFVVTGENKLNCNVVLTDFVCRIKRHVREYLDATIVYDRSKANRQRRIPAITTVARGEHAGRLITAYDFRWCNADLAAGNIDLQIAKSDDNGKTWTEPDFARDANGNPVTEYNHKWTKGDDWGSVVQKKAVEAWDAAWGDAALVADRESGTVMMIAVGGPIGFFGSRRDNTQSAIRWISHDGGDTWEGPENITEKIYSLFDGEPTHGKIDGMFFGSGRAMQSRYVKVGKYYRVYTVISTQNGGGNLRNFVLYTDDMGETWNVLGTTGQCPVPSVADEPKAEELPDGSVLLAARRNGGNRNFNVFRYTNPTTGEGQWLGRVQTNMGMGTINACDGEIYILPVKSVETGEKAFMALQSFPYGGSRKMVSIAWKLLNEGADFVNAECFTRWGGRYQVAPDGHESAYTTMSLMHDGNIGFFYEEALTNGAAYDGVFKALPISLITDGKYEYVPDHGNEIAVNLTKSLAEYRMTNYSGNDADAVNAAAEAYLENPTYENYIKFNRAECGYEGTADQYDFDYAATPIWPGTEGFTEDFTIESESVAVKVGETAEIVTNRKGAISWISSNELVATVSGDGVVTGVNPGSAVITATLGFQTATCVVLVEAKGEENPDDAITEISADGSVDVIFDLQGRRVIKAANGLYIVNGKKVKK